MKRNARFHAGAAWAPASLKTIAVLAALVAGGVHAAGFDPVKFHTPESMFSPGYFWMWNAKLDPAQLNAQLDDMVAHGVRSVCTHPVPADFRPETVHTDMSPDYLTPGYLAVFAKTVDHMAELGMNAWLYDEGGWPSGSACGLVAKADRAGRFQQRYYGPKGGGPGRPNGVWKRPYGIARSSLPSVIEPGATEQFVALTHEAYRKVLGRHFGKTIKFTFMDEPEVPNDYYGPSLGWASDFAEQFLSRKGYDFRTVADDFLAHKHADEPRYARMRIDYYDVLGQLFDARFHNVIRAWCRRNGLRSSGHMNGEDIPEAADRYGYGSLFAAYRAMDIPGVDVIWRQLYPTTPTHPGAQPPFPRYASSVGHQKGERLALSESFAIYGDSFAPDHMKWLVDYQMVRGINLFVFGYYAVSNAGQWMDLFEPHSGPVTPWWDMIRPYFDYVSRTASLLAEGEPTATTAVFFDTRAFWAGGTDGDVAGRMHYAAAKTLDERNVEYEFVDDEALAKAEVKGGALVVGRRAYRTFVLPTQKWMSADARAKLDAFRRAGGTVATLETISDCVKPTCRIAGREASWFRVAKRVMGSETLYFIVNERDSASANLKIAFDEAGELVHADPLTGRFTATGQRAEGFTWRFPPFGSALFVVGAKPEAPVPPVYAERPAATLAKGWTLRPLVQHGVGRDDFEIRPLAVPEVPVELGDWRDVLGGTFSGRAVYRTTFTQARAGEAWLDLGAVRWAASVRLNGRDLGPRFFGPYRWRVALQAGENVLEVTVANMLCNALTDEVRNRIARDFPPRSTYDVRQGVFDRENNVSGLFGPVTLR